MKRQKKLKVIVKKIRSSFLHRPEKHYILVYGKFAIDGDTLK